MQQPFTIFPANNGVQTVDPLAPDVIELLRKRLPTPLRLDLRWAASAVTGDKTQGSTEINEHPYPVLIVGGRSDLETAEIRIRPNNSDRYLSNDYIPCWGVLGGISTDRQPYRWASYLYMPSKTALIVEALLGTDTVSGGGLKRSGILVFDAIAFL